ncbi:MAG: hypothetical protein FWG67_06855 [Defluviitaleaceae bacterium]|nr:hypothetical protein [Defluviitaleaceae bacterium]
MTYEKFEHKVIEMLLEGTDPKLEKLLMQARDGEVVSREENATGFTVAFSVPSFLAVDELAGTISGVTVKHSNTPILQLELIIKAGLVNQLNGTYTAKINYSEALSLYDELTLTYANGKSSELNFRSHEDNSSELTLVKNITTLSEEAHVNTAKVILATEKVEEQIVRDNGGLNKESLPSAQADQSHREIEEVATSNLIKKSSGLASRVEALKQALAESLEEEILPPLDVTAAQWVEETIVMEEAFETVTGDNEQEVSFPIEPGAAQWSEGIVTDVPEEVPSTAPITEENEAEAPVPLDIEETPFFEETTVTDVPEEVPFTAPITEENEAEAPVPSLNIEETPFFEETTVTDVPEEVPFASPTTEENEAETPIPSLDIEETPFFEETTVTDVPEEVSFTASITEEDEAETPESAVEAERPEPEAENTDARLMSEPFEGKSYIEQLEAEIMKKLAKANPVFTGTMDAHLSRDETTFVSDLTTVLTDEKSYIDELEAEMAQKLDEEAQLFEKSVDFEVLDPEIIIDEKIGEAVEIEEEDQAEPEILETESITTDVSVMTDPPLAELVDSMTLALEVDALDDKMAIVIEEDQSQSDIDDVLEVEVVSQDVDAPEGVISEAVVEEVTSETEVAPGLVIEPIEGKSYIEQLEAAILKKLEKEMQLLETTPIDPVSAVKALEEEVVAPIEPEEAVDPDPVLETTPIDPVSAVKALEEEVMVSTEPEEDVDLDPVLETVPDPLPDEAALEEVVSEVVEEEAQTIDIAPVAKKRMTLEEYVKHTGASDTTVEETLQAPAEEAVQVKPLREGSILEEQRRRGIGIGIFLILLGLALIIAFFVS